MSEAVDRKAVRDALVNRHGERVYKILKNSAVAVAGLGGLGSNIAAMLARAGVGKLLLVDFDVVDMTNLNRQNYYISHLGMKKTDAAREIIRGINPYIEIETADAVVTEENAARIFSDYDIVCEAFDKPKNKAMLVNTMLCAGKTVVSGNGMAGYLSANTIKTRKFSDNLYMCGDMVTDAKDTNGLMAPRVAVCAAHEANMVLRILLKEREA